MSSILQLKITLKDSNPVIWRRFLVSDFWTFDKLHRIIQRIMGWQNYHLYEFNIGGIKIGLKDEDVEYELKNAKTTKIFEYIESENQEFEYLYDFGDSWEHEIKVEKIKEDILEEQEELPICLNGERACPPEDCGGIGGYYELIRILKDKSHKDHKRMTDWAPKNFNPDKFDINEINEVIDKRW